ncbi:MAG: AbrB/MazE/SpoVT family DNA-binding domain-containing protein [Nitrososphaerales archaeon]
MTQEVEFKAVKISDKGQIAIPAKIRREMKITKGDELLLIRKGDRIVLEKPKKFASRLEDEFKDISFLSESSLKKLWSYKGDDIWNKYLERGRKPK